MEWHIFYLFLLELDCVGGSTDEPKKFLSDPSIESLLCSKQRECSVSKGKPHLPSEYGLGTLKKKINFKALKLNLPWPAFFSFFVKATLIIPPILCKRILTGSGTITLLISMLYDVFDNLQVLILFMPSRNLWLAFVSIGRLHLYLKHLADQSVSISKVPCKIKTCYYLRLW